MRTFRATNHCGERIILSSDDTFTLQIHGQRADGEGGERVESTPYILAQNFSRRTLLALARRGDSNDKEKIAKALQIVSR